jgi:predicted alpha/beta hydrolase
MNQHTTVHTENVTLTAADGYPVAATRYAAQGAVKGNLVIAGATGVRREFYRRFAEFASRRGYTVLTLDYRGIGGSRPPSLKGFEMYFLDWGKQDLAAGVTEMGKDGVPLFMVGHSYGGHALGLLPNHDRVRGLYVFGTGAGWHGWMPRMEGLRVRLMWHVVLPVFNRWKGYSPWAMLGMGEDLPMGVFRQWRRWCTYPNYFFDDPELPEMEEIYARVKTPIVAVNALDDIWALPRSRNAFVKGYRNAPVTRIDLDPKRLPGGIGHMGYFREKAEPLWADVIAWIDGQLGVSIF